MPAPINGGIQNLICDISNLVHDVSSLVCGGGTQSQTQPTHGTTSQGSACIQTVIQRVLSEFCGGGNLGNNGSQPVSFLNPSGPSSGICDIVNDVKDIACDIVGLIPSGCGSPPDFSDVRLKEDIVPLNRLANGLGLYRFRYKWSDEQYVGVMAQEVEQVQPDAVVKGSDGYLRVYYDRLGLKFMKWDRWLEDQGNRKAN